MGCGQGQRLAASWHSWPSGVQRPHVHPWLGPWIFWLRWGKPVASISVNHIMLWGAIWELEGGLEGIHSRTHARSLQREHNAAPARAAAAPSPQVDAWRRPLPVPTSFCAAPCASEVPGVPVPAPQPAREAGRPEAIRLTRRRREREQRRKSRRVEAPPAGVSGEMEARRGRTAGPPPGSSSSG